MVGLYSQALLLKSFSQADTSTTRKFGGTGLGRAICKQLVEQMGGQIAVASVFGQGSTFGFTVRLTPQPAQAPTKALSRGPLHGRRVCIVDDNATSRKILEQHALHWELQSASTADGYEALALMRHAVARSEPFDVAIIDFQMPRMDGFGWGMRSEPILSWRRPAWFC